MTQLSLNNRVQNLPNPSESFKEQIFADEDINDEAKSISRRPMNSVSGTKNFKFKFKIGKQRVQCTRELCPPGLTLMGFPFRKGQII